MSHHPYPSRLPGNGPETADEVVQFVLKTMMDTLPVTSKQIAVATQRCPVLSQYCLSC